MYDYLGSSGLGIHHHLVGLMFGLGMRLPRKSRDKTRTLHACVSVFVCLDLVKCACMLGCA